MSENIICYECRKQIKNESYLTEKDYFGKGIHYYRCVKCDTLIKNGLHKTQKSIFGEDRESYIALIFNWSYTCPECKKSVRCKLLYDFGIGKRFQCVNGHTFSSGTPMPNYDNMDEEEVYVRQYHSQYPEQW